MSNINLKKTIMTLSSDAVGSQRYKDSLIKFEHNLRSTITVENIISNRKIPCRSIAGN